MNTRGGGSRHLVPAVVLAVLAGAVSGCAGLVMPGTKAAASAELDRRAMGITIDRDDITSMVSEHLGRLQASAFWQQTVCAEPEKKPLVAIWPIQNATTEPLADQMLALPWSIETALAGTNSVQVADRGRQAKLAAEIGIHNGAAFDVVSAQKLAAKLGARYFVVAKITSVDERLNKMRRVQYSLSVQVLDIETGLIRFQSEVSRTKALQN